MTFHLKDPKAVLDYAIDWGAEYLGTQELLASSDWTAVPEEPGGITVAASDFDTRTSRVKASGGIAGQIYRLVNRVTTSASRTDERSLVIRVEER